MLPERPRGRRLALSVATAALAPLVAWLVVRAAGPRALGAGALAVSGLLAIARARAGTALGLALLPFVPAVLLAAATTLADDARYVLTTPALISGALLLPFATSLLPGRVPVVERFARLERARRFPDSKLSDAAVTHCRRFTRAWTAFLATNTVLAALLAWAAPLTWWVAYTCAISYACMGVLVLAERGARARMQRGGHPLHVPASSAPDS